MVKFLSTAFFIKHLRWLLSVPMKRMAASDCGTLLPYWQWIRFFRSSRSLMFFKIGVKKFNRFKIGLKLQNIAIFIGKHLCWSLFLIRLQAFQDCNFIKMRLQHRCFPVNIAKFLRTTFFTKHVKWLQLIFS